MRPTRAVSRFLAPLLTQVVFLTSACSDGTPQRATLTESLRTILVPHQGKTPLDRRIARRQEQIRNATTDQRAAYLESLGCLFISKARISSDPGYYKLAERCAHCIEEGEPGNAAALLIRGHVLHSLHEFRGAGKVARQLVDRRGHYLDHGLLGDVLLDQGKVDIAGEHYQRMMDLKPCLQSYARAARVRWIRGDLDGAHQLLSMASSSGSLRDPESLCWVLSRLGVLDLHRGLLEQVDLRCEAALQLLPEHPPSLLLKAKVLLARGDATAALAAARTAAEGNPLPEYRWFLADLLRENRLFKEAERLEAQLHSTGARDDARHHALFLLSRPAQAGSASQALRLARQELQARQDIHTHDLHAWALLAAGQPRQAATAIQQALRHKTRDARPALPRCRHRPGPRQQPARTPALSGSFRAPLESSPLGTPRPCPTSRCALTGGRRKHGRRPARKFANPWRAVHFSAIPTKEKHVKFDLPLSLLAAAVLGQQTLASSHMDAPLITLDDAANTTDVYAFVSMRDKTKYLTTALSVYPFEDPGIGPNRYNFDDNVLYTINLSLGNDLAKGRTTMTYYFLFWTEYRNRDTILQSYTGVVKDVGDPAQNLLQRYAVFALDMRPNGKGLRHLGGFIVPPNNQGNATPEYNTMSGEGPAKDGVASASQLDKYTQQGIAGLKHGYRVFAGQRDDGFYADIQATFDLLKLRKPGKDSQKGFNCHTIALDIPVDDIGGEMQVVGVHATTMRRTVRILLENGDPIQLGEFVQVGRQGNPLFCEAFIAIKDKDTYNRTRPDVDSFLFRKYATEPELARLLNALVFTKNPISGITTGRTDLAGIFIPDLIKVDLSTGPARLAGGGPSHKTNPDDSGFSRLSLFGGDTLKSKLTKGDVPGGWPNGRRFGDDVYDIGVSAVISDLRPAKPVIRQAGDNVDGNDIAYNKVFPYAATPLNGRNHKHDD